MLNVTSPDRKRRFGRPNMARRMLATDRMAMDSAFVPRRRARDQEEPDDGSAGMQKIKIFLQNRLSPTDFQMLESMLQQLNGGGEQDDDPNHDPDPMPNRPQGRDQPPAFRGMPQQRRDTDLIPTGPNYQNIPEVDRREIRNSYAQDARGSSYYDSFYYDSFPANAFVDVNNYGG